MMSHWEGNCCKELKQFKKLWRKQNTLVFLRQECLRDDCNIYCRVGCILAPTSKKLQVFSDRMTKIFTSKCLLWYNDEDLEIEHSSSFHQQSWHILFAYFSMNINFTRHAARNAKYGMFVFVLFSGRLTPDSECSIEEWEGEMNLINGLLSLESRDEGSESLARQSSHYSWIGERNSFVHTITEVISVACFLYNSSFSHRWWRWNKCRRETRVRRHNCLALQRKSMGQ